MRKASILIGIGVLVGIGLLTSSLSLQPDWHGMTPYEYGFLIPFVVASSRNLWNGLAEFPQTGGYLIDTCFPRGEVDHYIPTRPTALNLDPTVKDGVRSGFYRGSSKPQLNPNTHLGDDHARIAECGSAMGCDSHDVLRRIDIP